MARTILQIYDEMISEKETMIQLNALQPSMDSGQTLLNDLTSTSKVAVWRLIFFVVAVQVWTLEKLFDDHKAWIEQRALEIQTGTLSWYEKKAKEFQYGDSLQFIDDIYQYSPVNPANRVVHLASATEAGNLVVLKVAKNVANNIEELSPLEITAFQAYLNKVRFAGTQIVLVSRPADLLKVYYKIYYDPLLLSPSGELLSTPGVYPVEEAINEYCKGLTFDGKLSITQLTDALQGVVGVVNPVFQNASAKYGSGVYAPIIDYYNPNAGYLKIDTAFPLNTTITYLL